MIARNTPKQSDFLLPDLGEGLEDAELIEWCVHVGQRVQENDILAKMETAKALVEVPSPRGGVIAFLHGKPGDQIRVGSPLVSFWEESQVPMQGSGEARVQGSGFRPPNPEPQTLNPEPPEPSSAQRNDAGTVVGALGDSGEEAGRVRAAPAVRRLARDLGVDIEEVAGTGIGGRVTARDVQAAAHPQGEAEPAVREIKPSPKQPEAPQAPSVVSARPHTAPDGRTIRIPFRGIRRTIAEHLRDSVTHAVHFTVMDEADVTALEDLRRRLVAASNEKISLLPFVASAVCRVLTGRLGAAFARLNSTVDDEQQEIVQHHSVHLGIATDTESGLMVPVIRDAHHLGVLELSRRIAQIAQAARERSLAPDLLSGSTFTISNFGSYAGRFGTPIINYPEAGILGMGRAREGVVVRGGMLGVGRLLPLSLAADHRVIDGATAASSLAKIIELLQSPQELLPPGGQEIGA